MGEVNAAPIVSNVPGSFPWLVWHERHPALFAQIRAAHPYPPDRLAALDALLAETLTGTMRPLPERAPDKESWDDWGRGYVGGPWLDAPFLWAESYFYRRLLDAVGHFARGPWRGLDPFEFLKSAELRVPALDADLRALDGLARLPVRERTRVLMDAALWGNRADLGFRIGVAAASGRLGRDRLGPDERLVVDDSAAALSIVDSGAPVVCLVTDNAGRELVSDLVFVDHLLDAGLADRVVVHLKPRPYYVSDAVTADLVACWRRLAAAGGSAAGEAAARLRARAADGRLVIGTHWFYCAPLPFHAMPPDLADEFAAASVVILKGDLNYRRLVGDRQWPADTPFAEAAGYFPAPVVALRTLKSDVVVGVDAATVAALDAEAADWRTNGRYALVQVRR